MLLQELRAIKSGRKERHQFGLVISGALLLLGGVIAWRATPYPAIFAIAVLVVTPVLLDKIFKTDTAIVLLPFQKVWMGIAVVLGFIVSRAILGILFFVAFTGVRGVNALMGKPLLDTAWNRGARESYWIIREPGEDHAARSEKQY